MNRLSESFFLLDKLGQLVNVFLKVLQVALGSLAGSNNLHDPLELQICTSSCGEECDNWVWCRALLCRLWGLCLWAVGRLWLVRGFGRILRRC